MSFLCFCVGQFLLYFYNLVTIKQTIVILSGKQKGRRGAANEAVINNPYLLFNFISNSSVCILIYSRQHTEQVYNLQSDCGRPRCPFGTTQMTISDVELSCPFTLGNNVSSGSCVDSCVDIGNTDMFSFGMHAI